METIKNNRYLGLWLAAVFFAIMIAVPFFLQMGSSANSTLRTLNNVGIYAALALSLNVILGQTGLYNMGHAAFFAVGAYAAVILSKIYGIPIIWALPFAGIIAALFAFLVALPVIHLRGDYLLVVTIGIVQIVGVVLNNNIFNLTGGPNGISGIKKVELFGYVFRTQFSQFYLIWGMVAVTVLLFYFLEHSRFGRALNYIKYDEVAATGNGINIVYYKIAAFVLGAFWAGMVGTIAAPFKMTISPESFNYYESIFLFAIVILAGGGNIAGVIVASFILIGLQDFLAIFGEARMLVLGIIMVVVMILRPDGLFPPRRRRYKARDLIGKFPAGIQTYRSVEKNRTGGEPSCPS